MKLVLCSASCLDFSMWPRGVTVSTLDSESSDRGSNPREAFMLPSNDDIEVLELTSLEPLRRFE